MKVRIEIEDDLNDSEVIIRCPSIDEKISCLQKMIHDLDHSATQLIFYQNDTEYYIPLHNILFFETDAGCINAHTIDNVYQVKHKLYELEELLPGFFMRVSKSTILNINRIYAITKNITASSIVQFERSHKQVFVSRNYYKALKERLEEKRLSS